MWDFAKPIAGKRLEKQGEHLTFQVICIFSMERRI